MHAGSGLLHILSDSVWLLQASEFSAFVDHAGLVGEGFQLQPGCFIWRLKRFGDVLGAALLLCPVVTQHASCVWGGGGAGSPLLWSLD